MFLCPDLEALVLGRHKLESCCQGGVGHGQDVPRQKGRGGRFTGYTEILGSLCAFSLPTEKP